MSGDAAKDTNGVLSNADWQGVGVGASVNARPWTETCSRRERSAE